MGPFFAVATHPPDAASVVPWHPMIQLVDHPDLLLHRIRSVRASLAFASGREPEQVELRVAASVTHLGLVARLIACGFAFAVRSGRVLDTDLEHVWWQDQLGGPFPLSVPEPAPGRGDRAGREEHAYVGAERLGEQVGERLINGPVRELTRAVVAIVSISERVLWGNAASALNSAVSIIGTQQPGEATRAANLAEPVLTRIPFTGPDVAVGSGFRRHSCCLIYRLAATGSAPPSPSAVCGDCVLIRS